MNEEYLNNLKKMDQERREAILKNHKQSKSPAPIRKPAKSLKVWNSKGLSARYVVDFYGSHFKQHLEAEYYNSE